VIKTGWGYQKSKSKNRHNNGQMKKGKREIK
jgi:hypothetical protein